MFVLSKCIYVLLIMVFNILAEKKQKKLRDFGHKVILSLNVEENFTSLTKHLINAL